MMGCRGFHVSVPSPPTAPSIGTTRYCGSVLYFFLSLATGSQDMGARGIMGDKAVE